MQVWAFWRNPCIYESAAETISLHRTKQGAWKAKNRFMNLLAINEREADLRHGVDRGRKYMEYQSFGLEAIDVED